MLFDPELSICLFIVFVYIPYWYDCTIPTHTFKNDIDFIKNMKEFGNINKKLSEVTSKKFTGDHLWYLGYHLSALGFFDERISIDKKRRMAADIKLNKNASEEDKRKFNFSKKNGEDYCQYISCTTREFFDIMNLDSSFLEKDPSEWENNESYKTSRKEILYLHVVNYAAERALSSIKNIRSIKEDVQSYRSLF